MKRAIPILAATAVALAGLPAAEAAAARCTGSKRPTMVAFTPGADRTNGVVSWKRPRRPRHGTVRYRVLRDGAVIGQTTRRRMKVRVSPGRTYRFTVQVVSKAGHGTPCKAKTSYDVRRVAPTAPQDLAASDVTETGATLSWSPAQSRAGKLAGYRVFRDGEPLRQTTKLSTTVALSAKRSYVFTVAAVDRTGAISKESNAVTIETGHAPPSAPGTPAASNVTDSGFDLAWGASTPSSGRVVGYRVYRDGTMLRQVAETHAAIANLAAAQRYDVTVVAVDSLGYLSDPSATAGVTTAMPPPSQGRAHAFLLATTGQSFTDLREHYQAIGTVYPTYFDCNADGTINGKDDPLVTRWAQLRRIRVMPRLDCQNGARIHSILTDPGARGTALGRLSELVQTYGYDGVNIDFESGYATDRDALTSFVTDLATILHGQGRRVSVAVSATTKTPTSGRAAFYDYPGLGAAADTVFVMNWGKHWATSGPGATSDLDWATQVADFIATMPSKSKYVLGSGIYGMDWPAGGGASHPATPLEWSDVQNLIAAVGATPVVDPIAGAPHFSYTDAQGIGHDVWYNDAASLAAHVRLAHDRGLGIGFWRLGREDPALWSNPLLQAGTAWPAG